MHKRFLALATLILLTASLLRLWQLATYPPGPHYDEAVYLLISRSIAFGGARFFPMVEAYQGREVLHMYLNAPLLHLIGDNIFTLRVTSAFCNLITIAASIALGRMMFRGQRGWIVGLAVGVLMALSFPQVWLARQAFRAVTLPMCQALALAFLWRGLRVRQREGLWLAIGGAFAGLALYTYNSSRLFPLWLLIAALVLLIADRANWRARLRQGAIFFGVLAVVAAPMGIYAVQRPDVFFGRLAEVTQPEASISLWESIVLHARMLFVEGDPYLRYNIPGRPYLTLPEGLLMLVGLGVSAWRLLRRRVSPVERAAYALALLSPLMVIPSVISVGGLPPSHMRSLGMIPLIFVLVAVGFEWVIGRLIARRVGANAQEASAEMRSAVGATRRVAPTTPIDTWLEYQETRRKLSRPFSLALIAVLVIGAVLVGEAYFAWAGRADVFYETDADLSLAAKWLVDNYDEEIVYIAARDKGHPTAMVELIPPVTWLGLDTIFRPPQDETGLYLFPRSAPPPDDWRAWLEQGRITDLPLAPDGQTAFEAFRIDSEMPLPPLDAAQAENAYLELIGANVSAVPAGQMTTVTLAWQINAAPPYGDFTPLLQLEDALGNILDRVEPYMMETDRWRPGEVMMQRFDVTVPAATPPGMYRLRAAWVGRGADQYESYLGDEGLGGIWADVGTLAVERAAPFPQPSALPIAVRADLDIAAGLRLIGWDALPHTLRPGEAIPLTLYWQAEQDGVLPLALNAQLDGTTLDTWSLFDGYDWRTGEILAERKRLTLPRQQVGGEYSLTLDSGDVTLGTIGINGIARLYEAPEVDTIIGATFGSMITLYGYTFTVNDAQLKLELVWQARQTPTADYTVFIHIVDESGRILLQSDVMPLQSIYATSLWSEGEYVVDPYEFELPQGAHEVRVGLYRQDTGDRLKLDENRDGQDYIVIRI